LAEPQPLALATHRNDDLAVGRAKGLVRHDVRVAVATPLRCLPGREGVLSLVDQAGESGLEDRYVDSLPVGLATLPSEQRRENRDGPEQPGHYVADRHPDLRRVAAVRVHE